MSEYKPGAEFAVLRYQEDGSDAPGWSGEVFIHCVGCLASPDRIVIPATTQAAVLGDEDLALFVRTHVCSEAAKMSRVDVP